MLLRPIILSLALAVGASLTSASEPYAIQYRSSLTGASSGGDFAPYYMASNRHGVLTQANDLQLRQAFWRPLDMERRFSYAFGIDAVGGYSSSADYLKYDATTEATVAIARHAPALWLQQLYGMVKYRGVFLSAGLREHSSALLSEALSSGDLVESGNARAVPQVRIGFIDFQDIPFTHGWVQIQGEISYGKMLDNRWMRQHFNYYTGHINQGALFTYKRCYFRTKPSQPLSVTVGMQVGGLFGGTTDYYSHGKLWRTQKFSRGIKQFFKMWLPTDGGKAYYEGSTLGSWDLLVRYRLPDGTQLKAYMQKPWEDGSGIGLLNGFDGLWGLEYQAQQRGIVSGAVVEYIDFTNQSGPMHWDPDDNPGTTITSRAEGADNYYNNHQYNSYANYGMSMGTPFMPSPIYNLNGDMQFRNNRVRGFHLGLTGTIGRVDYRLLGGYRKGWGTPMLPLLKPTSSTSLMAEATYGIPSIPGLSVQAQMALDEGSMFGHHFGAAVTLAYRGILNL